MDKEILFVAKRCNTTYEIAKEAMEKEKGNVINAIFRITNPEDRCENCDGIISGECIKMKCLTGDEKGKETFMCYQCAFKKRLFVLT